MAAIIEFVQVRIAAVYPGVPTMVDAVVAGVQVRAEWVGAELAAGDGADVELEIDDVLAWGDTIAVDDAARPPRDVPLLRATVELQERETLILRIDDGLVQVEVDDATVDTPPGTVVTVTCRHLKLYPTNL